MAITAAAQGADSPTPCRACYFRMGSSVFQTVMNCT
jgi:hypothetical protein